METNYLCNLIVTHVKPKPEKDISKLIITHWEAEPDAKDPPHELEQRATLKLLKYFVSKLFGRKLTKSIVLSAVRL